MPIFFVGILVLIKGAVEDSDTFSPEEIPAIFPSNNEALKIFSFTDYVTALQAERKCTATTDFPLPWRGGGGGGFGGPPSDGEGDGDGEGTNRALQNTPCQDNLAESPACLLGGVCDCADFVNLPESTGCGGVIKTDFEESSIDEICPLYCGVCSEGGEGSPPPVPPVPPSMSGGPPSFGGGSSLGISGIYNKGYNWQVPFVKCDSRMCKEDGDDAGPLCEYLALGVAPSSTNDAVGLEQAQAFRDFIYNRYPVLLDYTSLPFDFDFIQMMESNDQVEEYVKSKEYGGDTPKLALAVVFDGTTDPTINYNYAIRVNSTGFNSPEDEARPATLTTPPTDKLFETYARTDDESCPDLVGGTPNIGPYQNSCTGRYAYNGLLTIQRLVHDFVIADSGAAAAGYSVSEDGVQFVKFPSESYIVNGKEL